jgi:hypothetical protein
MGADRAAAALDSLAHAKLTGSSATAFRMQRAPPRRMIGAAWFA